MNIELEESMNEPTTFLILFTMTIQFANIYIYQLTADYVIFRTQ